MKIVPSGKRLGARVEGLDLASRLPDEQLRDFAARFGELEINVACSPATR